MKKLVKNPADATKNTSFTKLRVNNKNSNNFWKVLWLKRDQQRAAELHLGCRAFSSPHCTNQYPPLFKSSLTRMTNFCSSSCAEVWRALRGERWALNLQTGASDMAPHLVAFRCTPRSNKERRCAPHCVPIRCWHTKWHLLHCCQSNGATKKEIVLINLESVS